MVELAPADAPRPRLERADRPDHAAREEEPGEAGEEETEADDGGTPEARRVKRGEGLGERLLDEDEPAEVRDRGTGAQHRGGRRGCARAATAVARARARGRDLGQLAEVGVAQHEADVRVRDQPAAAVDHIGIALLADLEGCHHVPDQLEIDLGHGDAGIAPAAGQRDRHVGLGLLAEIDRAEIDVLGECFGEARVARVVGAAADHVHGEARDLELLLALAVELDELGDRRHLAQEAHVVVAALLDRGQRPLREGRPADLLLDLGDELLDALGRGLGLLLLQVDQLLLLVLIGEPEIERAVDQRARRSPGRR